ncbi:hypothetical protein BJX65DRAFT_24946 [Aspergillus insuetus]
MNSHLVGSLSAVLLQSMIPKDVSYILHTQLPLHFTKAPKSREVCGGSIYPSVSGSKPSSRQSSILARQLSAAKLPPRKSLVSPTLSLDNRRR